ncbi:MAG: hypothetical protein QG632_687 [Candidatus Dependentiae bacterium]|nr:hypothetical protein [Candidatus Dependentiae bacterium]
MHMKDFLPSACPGIHFKVKAFVRGISMDLRKLANKVHHSNNHRTGLVGKVVDACNMDTRNNKDMDRCLRRTIIECDRIVIFCHKRNRDLVRSYFTEDAVDHGVFLK